MQEIIAQMQAQLNELMAWKEKQTRQQLTYPLDATSLQILSKYFPLFKEVIPFTTPSGKVVPALAIFQVQNSELTLQADPNIYPFTVNTSTNEFVAPGHPFSVGDEVTVFSSNGTLPTYTVTISGVPSPAGMVSGVTYYVVAVGPSPFIFKLSLTPGGTPMTMTGAGGSEQYIYYQV